MGFRVILHERRLLLRLHGGLQYPTCDSKLPKNILPTKKHTKKENFGSNPVQNNKSKDVYVSCTANSWVCDPWQPCKNKLEKRNCRLIDHNCLNPESVRPAISKSCYGFGSSSNPYEGGGASMAKETLDSFDAFRERMLERGDKYVQQGSKAKEGMKRLASIDKEFVWLYNDYLLWYGRRNTPPYSVDGVLNRIANDMKELEKKFNELPIFYY